MNSRERTEWQERRAAERARNRGGVRSEVAPLHRGLIAAAQDRARPIPKSEPHRSQKLRDSARGEDCTVRIPGCPADPEKTIWSHYRGSAGGKAGARKSDDICGAYACTYCDAVYDGQAPRPAGLTKEDVDRLWLEGHIRSLVRVKEKGLLK